jgi:YVTN family beta-propeller protein
MKIKTNFCLSLSIILFILLFFGCSPTENTINDLSNYFRILYVTEDSPTKLGLISFPKGTTFSTDIFSDYSHLQLSSRISKITQYRTNYFVFAPQEYKIYILSKDSLKVTGFIDFSVEKWMPSDICFSTNGVDAFVIHENVDSVSHIDMTVQRQARVYGVGQKPSSIAISGNQVYVTNLNDNSVSVIGSNTHQVEATIPVSSKPAFVEISPDGSKALVICLGEGKIDSNQTKTDAVAVLIDIASRNIFKQKSLTVGAYKAVDQIPQGLSITSKNWAFIPTNQGVFRYDISQGTRLVIGDKGDFLSSYYNFWKNEEILLQNMNLKHKVFTADPNTGLHNFEYSSTQKFKIIYPVK